MTISKSQYIRGLQCHKSLWLYKNKPKLRSEPEQEAQVLFKIGDTVGECAKELFPGGLEIEFNPKDFSGMIGKTSDAISQGIDTLYEATFKENGVFAMADILHKTSEGWDMYEVKASTKVKATHINDAGVQWYALSQAINLNKAYIVHINNKYVREGEIDVGALFTIEDISDDVLAKQSEIPSLLKSMENMIKSDMPEIGIGPHCHDPYGCDFQAHCWSHVPDVSIFNLYRMWSDKKFELHDQGILSYEDIPKEVPLNAMQQKQVDAELTGEIILDKNIISNFLDSIKYPVSFFDFETFQNPIPRFDGQRAFMQMPFQYSLYVVDAKKPMTHSEFLGDENRDPRRALCEQMLKDIPKTGSIMAYYQSFEITCIKEMAKEFDDLSDALLAYVDRFVDLIVPFKEGGYYHPDFNGSFSIKSVLPALFPDDSELSYKSLNIQDGGMAMDTFANLHLLEDISLLPQIRQDLLAYCKLDTLAMVRIWEKLQEIAE